MELAAYVESQYRKGGEKIMSTRCNIDFYTAYSTGKKKGKPELVARIYKHFDGYPEEMVPLFKKFRKKMLTKYGDENEEAHGYGHMINNGEEIAAEFIKMFKPDYGDISVCISLHKDIEYLYELYSNYGFNSVDNWKLKIYTINNWDNKGDKKLVETVELK